MNLRRIEALLRMALDSAAAPNERDVALRESLRMVIEAQREQPLVGAEWRNMVMMRFTRCQKCLEKIKPLQKVYTRGVECMCEGCFSAVAVVE